MFSHAQAPASRPYRVRVHAMNRLSQDFHFAFPATSQYTPRRLRWAAFSSFLPRATPAGQEGASPVSSGQGKTRNCSVSKRFLGHLSVPSLPAGRFELPGDAHAFYHPGHSNPQP